MRVAIISFLAVYAFFYEYLPPYKRVHFIADIDGYHYPLMNYGFKQLRQGNLPEWDPTIYSGISYVGNIQAGLFYPPNWLVFYINKHRTGLRFYTIEALEILHYWIAFFLAWRWLRRHTRGDLPALLGAASFGLTGYIVAEAQHLGVVCGAAWFPMGLAAIDDTVSRKDWRCLWRLALALALCLTAGYPATWVAFCGGSAFYAIARGGWRLLSSVTAAVAFSCLLSMVQLAPTMEIASLKSAEATYGAGIPGGAFFYTGYFTPNYYDQSGKTTRYGEGHEQYNYLGAAAPIAIAALLWRRAWRRVLPALGVLAAAMWLITDPGGILVKVIPKLPLAGESCREWNFMAVLSVMAALLIAIGLDEFLANNRWRVPWWAPLPLIGAWSVRQWLVWQAGGNFATGWATMGEAAIHVGLLLLALCVSQPRMRVVLALAAVFVELKVYGTSRRFNSDKGAVDVMLSKDMRTGGTEMTGVDDAVYAQLIRNTHYRVLFPDASPATDLRHYGLRSPQGFDPFLPKRYIKAVSEGWESNRLFRIAVDNTKFHDDFAVKYILTVNGSKEAKLLAGDSRFRRMEPSESYFQVFDYRDAKPVWRFPAGEVQCLHWEPERRVFRARSERGGPFHLIEQNLPGWSASVDGTKVPVALVRTAFQGIEVPAGEHTVEFQFRSTGLRIGAVVSVLSLGALFVCAFAARRSSGVAIEA
ncbi:MAG: YfhO family protein [Bryobacterales bacterium]|nr:YfhO family protein [Bryobacterales bacterium]